MSSRDVTEEAPRRMTRAERQAETRARVLDAATKVFAEKGFHGATVEEITERAGFSRGAFYSNFSDKDDLFLALIDARLSEDVARIGALLGEASGPDDLLPKLREQAAYRQRDIGWSMVEAEFWLYAMRRPDVRPRLAERQRTERDAYALAIQAQFHAVGLDPPAPADLLALIVQVADHGILREQQLDPEHLAKGTFFDALDLLFRAAVALAGASGRS